MFRFLLLLPLSAALAGCVTTGSEAVREEGQSTVILHSSLQEMGCFGITMSLTQRDAAGRWIPLKTEQLKILYENTLTPSQVVLAPGEYGISNMYCQAKKRAFRSKLLDRPTFWDRNRPIVIDKPIAVFRVMPNEVVDIGSLQLRMGVARNPDGGGRDVFAANVTPIPAPVLEALSLKDPELYKRRVVRPMISGANI